MAERLKELEARKAEARVAGGETGDRAPSRQGSHDRARAPRVPARRGLVPRARHADPPRRLGHGPRRVASLHRRRHHRLRQDRRSQGLRLLPGLHRLRRRARRDPRREDPQDHGPRHDDGPADHRAQRRRRRAHPRGRRGTQRLRRDLLAQRTRVGRRAPDLGHPRAVRRRRGVLAGPDRLHLHGEGHEPHVHHRSRRREGRSPARTSRSKSSAAPRPTRRSRAWRASCCPTRRACSTRCATCFRSCRRTTWKSRRAS